jgi:hypothetical protein
MAGKTQDIYTINAAVTSGSANAYVEGEISTNLALQASQAMKILFLEIQHPPFDSVIAANDTSYLQLTKASKTAIVSLTDPDVILADHMTLALLTSGGSIYTPFRRYDFTSIGGILIAKEKLYLANQTVGWSAAATARIRIYYELVRLTPTQLITLVTD